MQSTGKKRRYVPNKDNYTIGKERATSFQAQTAEQPTIDEFQLYREAIGGEKKRRSSSKVHSSLLQQQQLIDMYARDRSSASLAPSTPTTHSAVSASSTLLHLSAFLTLTNSTTILPDSPL
ncbi:hypothetical protein JCGZ_15476 [Jatropha curcas]|uniref:Uncharacterized protein n=1 Tax=Jatropha curcas TaxID=180498 RepID=A0A067LBQ8_JATCU|nr:hypothetical protein JCGZ_15476 [Jatropha curcas]